MKSILKFVTTFYFCATLLAPQAFAYPYIDPSILTDRECFEKGGDWNYSTKLCTIYISDHDSESCAPEKAFRKLVKALGFLPEDSFTHVICGRSADEAFNLADEFCRHLIRERGEKFESCKVL